MSRAGANYCIVETCAKRSARRALHIIRAATAGGQKKKGPKPRQATHTGTHIVRFRRTNNKIHERENPATSATHEKQTNPIHARSSLHANMSTREDWLVYCIAFVSALLRYSTKLCDDGRRPFQNSRAMTSLNSIILEQPPRKPAGFSPQRVRTSPEGKSGSSNDTTDTLQEPARRLN